MERRIRHLGRWGASTAIIGLAPRGRSGCRIAITGASARWSSRQLGQGALTMWDRAPSGYDAEVPADFLYPLEQTGRQFVIHGCPATPEIVASVESLGEHVSFLLAVNAATVKRGDRFWFRAGRPEQRIVAVGLVQAAPYLGTDDEWHIVVAIDPVASERLRSSSAQPVVRAARQAVWKATSAEAAELAKIAML